MTKLFNKILLCSVIPEQLQVQGSIRPKLSNDLPLLLSIEFLQRIQGSLQNLGHNRQCIPKNGDLYYKF